MGLYLLTVFTLFFLISLPQWRYSRQWGYSVSGICALGIVVVLLLLVLDFIPLTNDTRWLARHHW